MAIIRITKSSSQCPVICNDRRQQGEVAKVKHSTLQPCLFQLAELSAPSMAPKGAKCLGLLLIQAVLFLCYTPVPCGGTTGVIYAQGLYVQGELLAAEMQGSLSVQQQQSAHELAHLQYFFGQIFCLFLLAGDTD